MLELLGTKSSGGDADITVVAAAVAMIQVTFGGTLFVQMNFQYWSMIVAK